MKHQIVSELDIEGKMFNKYYCIWHSVHSKFIIPTKKYFNLHLQYDLRYLTYLIGFDEEEFVRWYRAMRTTLGKATTQPSSGKSPKKLNAKDEAVVAIFGFIEKHIVRLKEKRQKPKSVS